MRHHSPDLRARAIDMLRAGSGTTEVAEAIGVDRKTVTAWRQLAINAGDLPRPTTPPKRSGVIAPAPFYRGAKWGAGW